MDRVQSSNIEVVDKEVEYFKVYIEKNIEKVEPFKLYTALTHENLSPQRSQQFAKNAAKAIKTLFLREQIVILLRFRGDAYYTLRTIGDMLHFSVERIRQIEADGLRKLRNPKNIKILFGRNG